MKLGSANGGTVEPHIRCTDRVLKKPDVDVVPEGFRGLGRGGGCQLEDPASTAGAVRSQSRAVFGGALYGDLESLASEL